MVDPTDYLSKISVPLGVITTFLAGSAWLTTTYNKVQSIDSEMSSFKVEFKEESEKVNSLDSRLSRIEGKIDLLIINMQRGKNAKNNDSYIGPR